MDVARLVTLEKMLHRAALAINKIAAVAPTR
jgi:hypothetical protein